MERKRHLKLSLTLSCLLENTGAISFDIISFSLWVLNSKFGFFFMVILKYWNCIFLGKYNGHDIHSKRTEWKFLHKKWKNQQNHYVSTMFSYCFISFTSNSLFLQLQLMTLLKSVYNICFTDMLYYYFIFHLFISCSTISFFFLLKPLLRRAFCLIKAVFLYRSWKYVFSYL